MIKRYVLSEVDVEIAKAVNDSMALFGISEDKGLAENGSSLSDFLPHDSIFINNRIFEGQKIHITTECTYWRKDGNMDCITLERSANKKTEIPISVFKRLIGLNILEAMRKITGYDPGPWGILRGVRPTKIVHRLLDQGFSNKEIIRIMASNYAVESAKAKLVTDIALRQRSLLAYGNDTKKIVSLYIGIPFCPSRCLYCSFPSYILPDENKIEQFLAALAKDIKKACALIQQYNLVVDSVYIGGGTPTSLNDEHFEWLLSTVKEHFITGFTREFTVEAGRPDSVNNAKIYALLKHGVSRVSVNPQSMQQKTLNLIGRNHTVQDIIDIFGKIRQLGIPVINMDVIAGLPGESEMDFIDTMEKIAVLGPDNLTVHTLTLKKGSILKSRVADVMESNSIHLGHNIQRMLDVAGNYARDMGMHPYYLYRQKHMIDNLENIGYARTGMECFYNINIMEERQTIIGIGPAAATKVVDTGNWTLKSCYNAKDLHSYISNVEIYTKTRQQLFTELFAKNEEEY